MRRFFVAAPLALLWLMAVAVPQAGAFSQYSTNQADNCAGCHGDFQASGYVSFKDGASWGTSLMSGHSNFMGTGSCSVCHQPSGRFPVILNFSTGITGFDPIGCVGCHGRDEGGGFATGAGLRQHHEQAGVATCRTSGCHSTTEVVAAGENVPPQYYFTPDAAHPNKPTNPCNNPPGTEAKFGLTGLDNDGDLLDDGADSDCAAGTPDIALNPTSLNFGTVFIGNTNTLTSQIENIGTADLTVTGIALAAGTSTEFGFTAPATPFVVSAGGTQTVTVTYSPVDLGADSGSLEITSDDPDEPTVSLAVSGSGEAVPVANINLDPAALNFGTVTVGNTTTLSTQIRNLGTANLDVTGVTRCAGTSTEFAFTDPGPLTILPGGAQTLSVDYSPTAAGPDTGCLEVASNDPDQNPAVLNLAGSGAAPANIPPTANANGPYSGTVGTPVAFDGSGSTDPDGTIVSYAWDFGDGNTGTGVAPSHTYAAAGTFTVSLTVTDNAGATGTDTTSANIGVGNTPPVADANGPYTGTEGVPVAFDGSGSTDSDGTIVSYDWDFGDGNTGTGATPSHTYAAAGTYTVSLTVTDDAGATGTDTTSATITAAAQGPDIAVSPLAVDFGQVALGDSAQRTVTVMNEGDALLDVFALSLTGSPNFAIASSGGLPDFIDPGASVDIVLSYTPSVEGTDSGELVIESNDPDVDEMTVTVTLVGRGVQASDGMALYNSMCLGCHGDPQTDDPAPYRKVPGARWCSIGVAIYGNPWADQESSPFPDGVPEMQSLLLTRMEMTLISDYLNSFPVSGEKRYVTTCAGCHGIDAKGGFVGEDVRGATIRESVDAIFEEDAMRYFQYHCLKRDDKQIGSYLTSLDPHDHDDD